MWLSIPLALLVIAAGGAGLAWPPAYARETPLWAAEGRAQDAVNIAVIVPLLLSSALLARRGSVAARIVWMGTLVYLLYEFALYCFAVHFSALFLVYTTGLGLSFYAAVGSLSSLDPAEIASRYGSRVPIKTMAGGLFVLAVATAASWLKEIVPAILAGVVPPSISEAGQITSPVYVLDLAIVLPAFVVAGVQLLRRKPVAFVLAPVLLVFAVLMIVALAVMVTFLAWKGFGATG